MIGDRIRIINEEEYRIMSPPRRPRGEKPQTTIRLQARQIRELEKIIAGLRADIADKQKVIAGDDVQISELDSVNHDLRILLDAKQQSIEVLESRLRANLERTAFLDGYYAKSTENLPQAGIAGRASAGDSGLFSGGGSGPEGNGPQTHSLRDREPAGREIRGEQTDDREYSGR